MGNCPTTKQLQLLLDERSQDAEGNAIEEHVQSCVHCQQALELLTGKHAAETDENGGPESGADFLQHLAGNPPAGVWASKETPAHPQQTPGQSPVTGTSVPAGSRRYTLTQLHAQGGIGQVWLAHDKDLGREVALKELRPERTGSSDARARFLAEAKITGQLEHPGIVPVYELVSPAEGQPPFYAMKFIRGRTLSDAIREYHERRKTGAAGPLDLRNLLGTFVTVCNAVAYAHSRGVIHRDLKGRNVALGDFGEAMVLDWGLAKVQIPPSGASPPVESSSSTLSVELEEEVLRNPTLQGQVLGTPSYMSPEQAGARLDEIDYRSDIYGLGAILYEILTGQPPFAGPDTREVLQRVVQEPPVPPGRRIASTPPALEAICLKAVSKRKEERYHSAGELAQEVQSWLADEPVRAYREPARLRLARWGRKHKTLASGGAVLLASAVVALTLGLVLLSQANRRTQEQWDRAEKNLAQAREAEAKAERSAAQAKAINRFLVQDLLAEAAPEKNPRGKKVTVEEVLAKAAQKLAKAFVGQPEVEAAIRLTLGDTYRNLGMFREAEPQVARCLKLCQEQLGPEHPDTLEAVNELALLLGDQGKHTEAENLFRRNLEATRRVQGPEHPHTMRAVNNLALLLQAQGKYSEAESLFRRNLEDLRRILGPEAREALEAASNLAALLHESSKYTEAESLYRQTLAGASRVLGPDDPVTLAVVNNLAALLQAEGKLAEAEPLLVRNLESRRNVLGPEHPYTLLSVNNLAMLLLAQRKLAEAESLCRQYLEPHRRVLGPEHPSTLLFINNLAGVLRDLDKLAEAETLFRQNLEVRRRVLGPEHPDTLFAVNNLALVLRDQGKLTEAEPLAREAVRLRRKVLPKDHVETATSLAILGSILTDIGKAGEAEPFLRDCLAIRRRALPKGHPYMGQAESLLGGCLAIQKRFQEAEPLLLSGYATLKEAQGVPPKRVQDALERVIKLYETWGDSAKAAAWRAKKVN
jgi:serine/threonine protein kinase